LRKDMTAPLACVCQSLTDSVTVAKSPWQRLGDDERYGLVSSVIQQLDKKKGGGKCCQLDA